MKWKKKLISFKSKMLKTNENDDAKNNEKMKHNYMEIK